MPSTTTPSRFGILFALFLVIHPGLSHSQINMTRLGEKKVLSSNAEITVNGSSFIDNNLLLSLNYGLYSVPLSFNETTFNAGEPTFLGNGGAKDIAQVGDLTYVLRINGIEMWED